MCNFILIVTFFTSTLTFAQDDKIPPAVPPQKAIPAPVPSSPAPTPAVRPSITVPKPEPQAAPAAAVAAKENAAKSPASGSAVSTMEAGLAASVLPRSAAQAPGLNLPRVYIPKDAYQIGIDDVLAISVIKPIPFITREIVTSDGNITFPYIGAVRAKGRTLADIQSEIQERLSSYMDYPVVSVSLLEARSKKFTIYGQVIRPGAYPVEANMSLLRAISLAGGLSVPGSTCMVKVLRTQKDGKSKSLIFQSEITAVLNGSKQDVVILPGDTVVVTIDKFFIYGEVNKPGSYYLEENMSLLDAITMAGSFIERGSTGVVRLSRAKGGEITLDIKDILGGKDRGVTVQAGDTINVTVDKFYIYGQIARPGAYPVRSNMSIMYAITAAGGLIQSGSM
ncbi:MAG: SLBB domain-containing protein, partial [Candidatus Omnitrophica bacterium]|nr:SLBB domain-containing protein [Candidatus Omnitrophota bacterium]